MTTPQQYQRAKALFEQACDLPPEKRAEFVSHFCDDPEVRAQVEQLLRADAADSTLLRTPPPDAASPPAAAHMPETIGPYRILSKLGVGGMGTVYEAEQQHPRRTVALKVVTPGLDAQAMMKRFQREANLLGRLQHDGIAQVFDAGSFATDAGPRPYFAMELVRGKPITDHAERQQLSTSERLALLKQVCDAMQHAHERGVIHRDLKPSNILVTDAGKPKVLDFGIARPSEPQAGDMSIHTRTGQLVGTVAYMSPEQASGRDHVDHRADVYSLGVIAYELLTGKLPFDLKNQMLHEAVRTIQEREVPSLSTVSRGLSTDLDTIVRKALAKEPDRRYQSAAELAEDIDRFLHAKPIAARPPSTLYQLRKFAQRNRALVTGVAVAFFALVMGLIATTVALRQAIAARNEAQAQHRQTEAALALLTDALYNVNPNEDGDANYPVSSLLNDIGAAIDANSDLLPRTKANLRYILGDALVGLGRYDDGLAQYEQAVETRTAVLGPEHPDTLTARIQHASTLLDLGLYEEAHDELESLAAISDRVRGPNDPETIGCKYYLANARFRINDVQGAASMYEAILAAFDQSAELTASDESDTFGATLASLAHAYTVLGRLDDASTLSRRSIEHHVRLYGPENVHTLTARNNAAILLMRLDRFEEADAELSDILAIRLRTLPPDHSDIGVSHLTRCQLYTRATRYDEAEREGRAAVDVLGRAVGPDHRYTQRAREALMEVYEQTNRPELAEPLRAATPPPPPA